MAKIDISIIVPAYKAEPFIIPSLKRIRSVLAASKFNYELICVIDGRVDRSFELAKNITKDDSKVIIFGYKRNRGKGYAVRYGMKRAKGDLIGFIDAGLEIDPKSIIKLLEIQKRKNADIVVGSKRHLKSKVEYPLGRTIISIFYYLLVKIFFNIKLTDTQAGIKLFKKDVAKIIIPKLQIDGFAFDIEILSIADNLGLKIYEAPIYVRMLKSERSSTIDSLSKLLSASVRMFYDTLALYFRSS